MRAEWDTELQSGKIVSPWIRHPPRFLQGGNPVAVVRVLEKVFVRCWPMCVPVLIWKSIFGSLIPNVKRVTFISSKRGSYFHIRHPSFSGLSRIIIFFFSPLADVDDDWKNNIETSERSLTMRKILIITDSKLCHKTDCHFLWSFYFTGISGIFSTTLS